MLIKQKLLVTGGVRSGKSDFALRSAESSNGELIFLATAEAGDDEMSARIKKHQDERSQRWKTVEEPVKIDEVLDAYSKSSNTMLIDCLGVWTSNILLSQDKLSFEKSADRLIKSVSNFKGNLVMVTNEVGFGIVPDNELSRRYRDMLGSLNKGILEVADAGVLVVCGAPIYLKGKE